MKTLFLAAANGLVFSSFLIVSPVFAQDSTLGWLDTKDMPTTHSTPAEQAETAAINHQVGAGNAAADTQADTNNANHQAQQQYRDRTAIYEDLHARYAAERATYHRGIWPDRYVTWVIVERDANLVGERVELLSGSRVGTVIDAAHASNGTVEALLVRLDDDTIVWIDSQDVRYNRADGIVMIDLEAGDLHHMADERL